MSKGAQQKYRVGTKRAYTIAPSCKANSRMGIRVRIIPQEPNQAITEFEPIQAPGLSGRRCVSRRSALRGIRTCHAHLHRAVSMRSRGKDLSPESYKDQGPRLDESRAA